MPHRRGATKAIWHGFVNSPEPIHKSVRTHRIIAGVISTLMIGCFLVFLPIASKPLSLSQSLAPFMIALTFMSQGLTAYLLAVQFQTVRASYLGWLTSGYAFIATMVLLHTVNVTHTIIPSGLLVITPPASAWLWVLSNLGFPVCLMIAALQWRRESESEAVWQAIPGAAGSFFILPVVIAGGASWLASFHYFAHVPRPFASITGVPSITDPVLILVLLVNGLALVGIMKITRLNRPLFIWIEVSLLASVISILFNASAGERYTVGWYGSWLSTIVASSAVLAMLMWDVFRLYREATERNLLLQIAARTDSLVGLPNRATFSEQADNLITRRHSSNQRMAVFSIDLNRFSYINEIYGFATGDKVLIEIAKRLRDGIFAGDLITRASSDEFVILSPRLVDQDAAETFARQIIKLLERPIYLDGKILTVGATIGISFLPDHGTDFTSLMRASGIACRFAKGDQTIMVQIYNDTLSKPITDYIAIESSLPKAIANDELFLEYQPQMNLVNGQTVGLEALVRWNHPTQGIISPTRMIPVAEEGGLITMLDRWVLETACQQMQEWRSAGLFSNARVAVNISALHFRDNNLVKHITLALNHARLPGNALEIEITESAAMTNAFTVVDVIKQLVELGVTVAIDDFGTGYSSLGYLSRFHVHKLKIDSSIITNVVQSAHNAMICNAIIGLSKNLQLRVIAEGVETESQLEFLRAAGCDEIQGYLFSRPLSPELARHYGK
jgi:diguanylate cyclase (GGDEF)-like protein